MNALIIVKRDRFKHEGPSCAHWEAAMVGALGIRLGGVEFYKVDFSSRPFLGDGERTVDRRELLRIIPGEDEKTGYYLKQRNYREVIAFRD